MPTIQINEWAVSATSKLILTLLTENEIIDSGGEKIIGLNFIKLLLENPMNPSNVTVANWRTSLWMRAIWFHHHRGHNYIEDQVEEKEEALSRMLSNAYAHQCSNASVSRIMSISKISHDYWFEYRLKYFKFPFLVIQLLKRLEHNFKLVMLTNGHEDIQFPKLVRSYAASLFPESQIIMCGEENKSKKPNNIAFQTAALSVGCQLNECIVVGDNLKYDIEGANLAHCLASVWVRSCPVLSHKDIETIHAVSSSQSLSLSNQHGPMIPIISPLSLILPLSIPPTRQPTFVISSVLDLESQVLPYLNKSKL